MHRFEDLDPRGARVLVPGDSKAPLEEDGPAADDAGICAALASRDHIIAFAAACGRSPELDVRRGV